jgi:dimethylhistidine N-methyltransferase
VSKTSWSLNESRPDPARKSWLTEFEDDVRRGHSKPGQKELYPRYLYDDVGSALFDVITLLPEYGLWRADARLLRTHSASLAEMVENTSLVVELGSGSGGKTRWILTELAARQAVTYCPVDISESALRRCCLELRSLDSVEILPHAQSYLDGLRQALRLRPVDTPVLVLFLGSTIGNFEPEDAVSFLSAIRSLLHRGDVLYLSADLEKEPDRMIAAYDDPIGVTAAFNLNLLARINRELGGNFVLSRFQHHALYNEAAHRIEMQLQSTIDQSAPIGDDFVVRLKRGETIRTECSYKFRCSDLRKLARDGGFLCETQWIDQEWPFAQSVLRAV